MTTLDLPRDTHVSTMGKLRATSRNPTNGVTAAWPPSWIKKSDPTITSGDFSAISGFIPDLPDAPAARNSGPCDSPTSGPQPTWEALSALRWGPSLAHDLPGLDVGRDRPLRPI